MAETRLRVRLRGRHTLLLIFNFKTLLSHYWLIYLGCFIIQDITTVLLLYTAAHYHYHDYVLLYDLVPKGAHARGYALQLKIKHCWKLFLFEMLCCVLAWMNELYIIQIISATRLWLISRYRHYTLKKRRKMTAKNGLIHVPSDFHHFAYKQIASTWRNNHWFVCGKNHFIWII